MSCKLLLNLVDCIKTQSKSDRNAPLLCRQLLMRMLEIFVLKFKTFAKLQLPILVTKSKPNQNPSAHPSSDTKELEDTQNRTRLPGKTQNINNFILNQRYTCDIARQDDEDEECHIS